MMRLPSFLRRRSSKVQKMQSSNSSEQADPEDIVFEKSPSRWDALRRMSGVSVSTCSTDISDGSDSSPSPRSSRHTSPSCSPRTSKRGSSLRRISIASVDSCSSVVSSATSQSSNSSDWLSHCTHATKSSLHAKRLSVSSSVSTKSNSSKRSSVSSSSSAWAELGEVIPNFEDRDEWFAFWDSPEQGGSGSGRLSRKQVVHALSRTFRQYDKKTIDITVGEVWADFDEDKEGVLGSDVLMKPQFGLIDTAHMLLLWSS